MNLWWGWIVLAVGINVLPFGRRCQGRLSQEMDAAMVQAKAQSRMEDQ